MCKTCNVGSTVSTLEMGFLLKIRTEILRKQPVVIFGVDHNTRLSYLTPLLFALTSWCTSRAPRVCRRWEFAVLGGTTDGVRGPEGVGREKSPTAEGL